MFPNAVAELTQLRQHRRDDGARSPHKPLLVLLALGRLARTGSSAVPWVDARTELASLLEDFGPVSKTGAAQAAAYPFTRLRSDGVWELDESVDMDRVAQLNDLTPTGRLSSPVEAQLAAPGVLHATARALVEAEFPPSLFTDVLMATGLDADEVSARWCGCPRGSGRRRGPRPSWPPGTGSARSAGSMASSGQGRSVWTRRTSGGSTTTALTRQTTGSRCAPCTTGSSTAER